MGNKWNYLPFTEAVEVNPSVPLKRGKIYPFVDMKAVESSRRGASESESREFKSGGARFMPFDTLMARITPCLENGKIARYIPSEGVGGPAFGSTEFIVIRGREGVTDNDYAYYLTKWEEFRQFAISQMTGSSGRQRVPADSLAKFLAPAPESLSEQRAIAHILGSLDDKIELNRQMAQTLESIARAIFKSWFVDFDPVKAKMEGKQPEGMSEEIAALFPDRLVDSELGMIPEGWEVLKFPEEFDFTMGQSPPGSSYNEYFNGVPFYQGSADFGQWYPTERIYCTAPTRFANKGDVLFSVRAPVGDMNIALSDCAIGRGLCCIRHKSGSTALTYLYLTNTKSVMEHNAGEGAVFKSLSKKQLTMLPVVSIPDVIAKSFIKIVDPIFEKIQSLEDNARTLCSLRDTLLPRLISGKIRLNQPEDAAA
ncbi:restriction endonuclease subunit S [Thiolapillus sp.]|uniref:restriction endonuclease subunit S n=4 Tax=Thiolapillus sp. TaxID=2017437 RepID=UPI003AF61148